MPGGMGTAGIDWCITVHPRVNKTTAEIEVVDLSKLSEFNFFI